MNIQNKQHRYFAAVALCVAIPAEAYIGPGLGAGTFGVILGLLGSVLIALFAFFWYPIKRIYKKWTASSSDTTKDDEQPEASEEVG